MDDEQISTDEAIRALLGIKIVSKVKVVTVCRFAPEIGRIDLTINFARWCMNRYSEISTVRDSKDSHKIHMMAMFLNLNDKERIVESAVSIAMHTSMHIGVDNQINWWYSQIKG